jgi:ArsR family transcriptional regulator
VTTVPVLDQLTVLADPLRVRMLAVLEGRELTVSELCDTLQLPQSTVSRHLKTLADGDWVASRRDGTSRLYTFAGDGPADSARSLWQVVRAQVADTATAAQDERRIKEVLAKRRTRSEAFFSSSAGQWDRLRDDLFGPGSYLQAILGLIDPTLTVADVGCGTGQVSAALAPFVRRVIAVDASAEMLEAARLRLENHPNVELRHGTLERLPIDEHSVDAVVMALVLHHQPDPAAALAEVTRVLGADGRVLLVDMLPHDHDEYRQTMGHVWLGFGATQIARLCRAAGLDDPRVVELPPDPRAKGPSLFVATARKSRKAEQVVNDGTPAE